MKIVLKFIILGFMVVCFVGCGKDFNTLTYKQAYPNAYKYRPNTMLILPPLNQTTAADAVKYATPAFSLPFLQRGYYVFPVELTNAFFYTENLTDSEQIHKIPVQKLGEIFGADIVLYPTIKKWDTDYKILSSNVVVLIDLLAVDARTGLKLWHSLGYYNSQTNADMSSLGAILSSAIVAGINSISTDYFSLAIQALNSSIAPYGQYNPYFLQSWNDSFSVNNLLLQLYDNNSVYGLGDAPSWMDFFNSKSAGSDMFDIAWYGYDEADKFFVIDGKKVFISEPILQDSRSKMFYPVKNIVDFDKN